jgi:hypothetical protein
MMNLLSHWRKRTREALKPGLTATITNYDSLIWLESELFPGVEFSIRKISLAQRIELTSRVRDLTLKNDFLKAGEPADQLDARLADLMTEKLYLEWAVVEVKGLAVDDQEATVDLVIRHGPEALVREMAEAIHAQMELSETERKNF